jgi:hypothetical protein
MNYNIRNNRILLHFAFIVIPRFYLLYDFGETMNLKKSILFSMIFLGTIFNNISLQAKEGNASHAIDQHIAKLVGQDNVGKAKIGGAIALGALGLFGAWFSIRNCACLQLEQETKKETVLVPTTPYAQAVGISLGDQVPGALFVEKPKIVYKQPSCLKRCLRCIFCVQSKNQK